VEQVLTTVPGSQAPSTLLTFRLTALLAFYLDTVKAFVPEGAALCVAIRDCHALAQRTLFDVLKAKGCVRLTAFTHAWQTALGSFSVGSSVGARET
jgi:hypothetical protein